MDSADSTFINVNDVKNNNNSSKSGRGLFQRNISAAETRNIELHKGTNRTKSYVGRTRSYIGADATITYNGQSYAALDGWSPSDSSTQGCQSTPLNLPSGWSIAQNNAVSIAVIAMYPWGTDLMVLVDGSQFYTDNDRYIGMAGQPRQWLCCDQGPTPLRQTTDQNGNAQYEVTACARRILIIRACTAGSFVQGPHTHTHSRRRRVAGCRTLDWGRYSRPAALTPHGRSGASCSACPTGTYSSTTGGTASAICAHSHVPSAVYAELDPLGPSGVTLRAAQALTAAGARIGKQIQSVHSRRPDSNCHHLARRGGLRGGSA